MKKPSISIIGLGFVGLSLAVVNAKNGFNTVAIDINKTKLKNLKNGIPDFYEPKLKNYLDNSLESKMIHFTDNLELVLDTDITFITVGTPPLPNGNIDLSHLKKVAKDLSQILQNKKSSHLVVIKSTVIPMTISKSIIPLFRHLKNIKVVSNPEFLREGSAIDDLLKPHLIVIGEEDKKDGHMLEKYYRIFYKNLPEIIFTNITTAEMIKYANNSFLATKISFINSIANLCQKIPMTDVKTISYAIGKDPRIGSLFLNAGPGFGGSCLPKDLAALIKFSDSLHNKNPLLEAVKEVNELQPTKIIEIMKEMKILGPKKIVSILGLAFKKNTDDVRESVSIRLIKVLIKNRCLIKVHDPMALDNIMSIFGDKISYCKTIKNCLEGSHCCILLTEWDEYRNLSQSDFKNNMRYVNIIDARRILDPRKFSEMNYRAIGLGANN